MNAILSAALLSCLTLPLAAQRYQLATLPRTLDLAVHQAGRQAVLASSDRAPFFGIMIASVKDNTVRIAGYDLLLYDAIVATAEAKVGSMALDLGKGGWGFDIYLQGVGLFEQGAMASNIAVVSDEAPKPKPE
jgi:hypothetical protein